MGFSARRQSINAKYEAASGDPEIASFYANADSLDADSANSRPVRQSLVKRSRFESQNNGYYSGISHTYSHDLIGSGPKLRIESSDPAFDRTVEQEWEKWSKAIGLRQKLLTMASAKDVDGEGLAVARTNPKVRHRVKIDVVLYETEQCQTPMLPYAITGQCDGIEFDKFGNPEYYHILRNHPGGQFATFEEPERVPSRYVLHFFKRLRPGQHRGVPERASTLNVGIAARRWREATIGAAEKAADIAVLLTTPQAAGRKPSAGI